MEQFSEAAMHRLISAQGDKRVSSDAAVMLGDILETFAGDVAEEAVAIAKEDKRNTVRVEDVKEALK